MGHIQGCSRQSVQVFSVDEDFVVRDLASSPVDGAVWVLARDSAGTGVFRAAEDGGFERVREVEGIDPSFVVGEDLLIAEDSRLRTVDGELVFEVDARSAYFCWSDELQLAVSRPASGLPTVFEPGAPPRDLMGSLVGLACIDGGLVALRPRPGALDIVEATGSGARTEIPGVSPVSSTAVQIASATRLTVVRDVGGERVLRVEHHVAGASPAAVDLGFGIHFASSQALLPDGRGAFLESYGSDRRTLVSTLMVFDAAGETLEVADEWEIETAGVSSAPLLSKVLATDAGYVLARHLHRELEVSRWSCRE